ncbi:LacI family DNA-binding transcriptional regulator [Capnocytophaga catalasegens]|uniref:LacI family transcriptional regulator n=1 Tax=Capnocytophaga catalasegens TaxID=1004260 RepID=A0AAV5AZG7_9FLAO|nr:LacI family DNA-binding transcriptional regulator [Capnocytophaga catalasegens]GIZ16136.1 LacI family transcriptional regulator [Capnocytophaga catalasegens]GJM50920.1 LacI family transcriptional regulator [Capnocytophaga catalasegens]GJM53764.1 LacI family transcriptional regulator [Capnocytophaga catalasegens]
MSPVTLKDLARRLGVSVTTVSKALKDYADIGKETKEQVKKLAQELNYQPNIHAVNLRVQKSKTFGVIIPKIEHYFFANVLNGIISEAEKNGYIVITLFSDDNVELEKQQVNLLINKRVDGIFMVLSHQSQLHEQSHIMNILAHNISLVLLDRTSSAIPCSKVLIDEQKAGYKATKHLLSNGAKHIMYLGGSKWQLNYRKRFNGYIQALHEFGIMEDERIVRHCQANNINEAQVQTLATLKENPQIDAIFASTDFLAFGAIKAIHQIGKSIPKDISVFGFSNWFMTEHLEPSISTIQQPSTIMGHKAVELMIDEIANEEKRLPVKQQTILLPTELILRQSTKNDIHIDG